MARSGQLRQAQTGRSKAARGRRQRDTGPQEAHLGSDRAVLEGSQDRGRAAVAIQGFNALRGVLELERKIKETDELEARIEALEQTQEGGRAWGA